MDITLANNDYILTKEFRVKIQYIEFRKFIDIYVYFVIHGPKAFQWTYCVGIWIILGPKVHTDNYPYEFVNSLGYKYSYLNNNL